ncbi:hypothetical protein K9M79_03065 [Candidatus Woesearchaeota archaeon]|nr:hypothetical protein [Candidatus Woesearchaeota archaeon]
MAVSDLGIVEADFTDNALADLGQTVSRTPITVVLDNESGAPTFTTGTPANITAIFTKRNQNYDWAKEGLFDGGDAFMQFDKDQAMNKDDRITFNGEKFRVDNIVTRQAGGNGLFKSCNLFLIE